MTRSTTGNLGTFFVPGSTVGGYRRRRIISESTRKLQGVLAPSKRRSHADATVIAPCVRTKQSARLDRRVALELQRKIAGRIGVV